MSGIITDLNLGYSSVAPLLYDASLKEGGLAGKLFLAAIMIRLSLHVPREKVGLHVFFEWGTAEELQDFVSQWEAVRDVQLCLEASHRPGQPAWRLVTSMAPRVSVCDRSMLMA